MNARIMGTADISKYAEADTRATAKLPKSYTVLEVMNGFMILPGSSHEMMGRSYSTTYIASDIEEVGRILKRLQNDKPVTA